MRHSTTRGSKINCLSRVKKQSKKKRSVSTSSPSDSSDSSTSCTSSTSSNSSDSTVAERKSKKRKRHSSSSSSEKNTVSKKKGKKIKKVTVEKKKLKHKRRSKDKNLKSALLSKNEDGAADVPLALMNNSRSMVPMTKEEWEKQQSVVRKVYDEASGRHRLIKGDGEVLEEIVSKERHKDINKQATKSDGTYFQTQLAAKR